MDLRFRKHQHILRGVDFRAVFDRRASVADNILVVYGTFNQRNYSRLGLSVSRKVGNAVVRNWWKRRIRESFRLGQHTLPIGIDLVVIPRARIRPGFQAIKFQAIDQSLRELSARVDRKLKRTSNR